MKFDYFHCPGCGKLLFKAKDLLKTVIEVKCSGCKKIITFEEGTVKEGKALTCTAESA